MAALVDFNDYKKRYSAPREMPMTSKSATTSHSGRMVDQWLRTALAGVAPTTPVVPARTIAGALEHEDAVAEDLFCLGASFGQAPGMYILCDRLSHQGGMSGTDTTVNQVTNLPTAALTRYTSGDGVMAGISIYSSVGSTGSTISCSYTNESGVSGRISPLMPFAISNYSTSSRFCTLPLMSGDTGVRSIENSTLTTTSGTAGNFGYVLYKPLMAFCVEKEAAPANFSLVDGGMLGGLPVIQDGACLFWLYMVSNAVTTAGIQGPLFFTAV